MLKYLLTAIVILFAALSVAKPWTHGCPTCSIVEVPGPSQNLFNHPWYTCTRNFYVATNGLDTNPGTQLLPWQTIQNADTASRMGGDCINVEPGLYSQGSAILNGGGSGPNASGYVTYRCTVMDACHIQSTSNSFVFFFGDAGSFVILDGFEIDGTVSGSAPDGFVPVCAGTTDNLGQNPVNAQTSGESAHHIWVMNSVIHDCNQSGTQFNNKEWYYVIHNQIYHNAYVNTSNGSGISYNVFNCVEGTLDVNCFSAGVPGGSGLYTSVNGRDYNYVPSGNDTASYNPILGRYAPFHIVTAWNLTYNNRINAFNYTGNPASDNRCLNSGAPPTPPAGNSGGHTDGNGIIMDSGITSPLGEANFTASMSGSNILNVSTMTGGSSPIVPNMVITAAGSFGAVLWNSRVQPYGTSGTTGTGGTGTYALSGGSQTVPSQNLLGDFNFPYQTLVLGNLSFYNGGRGVVVLNAGHILVANNTTFNNSTDTCLAKSETLVAELISNFGYDNTWINNIAYPIQTVYNNTCGIDLFDHYPGAPVNFYMNNVSQQDPTTFVGNGGGVCISNDDSMYWSNSNNKIQNPLWSNVSAGLLALVNTDLPSGGTWTPGSSNYALKPASPAIGYFASSPYVPSWLTDAGACQHTLSVCGFNGVPGNY